MLGLFLFAICFATSGMISRVEASKFSVSITTIPRQGPFRIGQLVQFSCEVEPAQPNPVTYKWRNVEYVSGGSIYSSETFNTTYSKFNLRYNWYFCTVTNGIFSVSANKLVEVHGLLQTDEPVVRTFSLRKRMAMRINISHLHDYNIISLAWYHNGTKLTSDDRLTVTNNGTSLMISNIVESDAGKYEVKINSLGSDPVICHKNILPMLENYALYAPVTFLLQEANLPTYNPEDVIFNYTLPAHQAIAQQNFAIDNTFMFNAGSVLDVTKINKYDLYKDGVRIQDRNTYNISVLYDKMVTQSLQISYDNTDDVAGHYVHQVYSYYANINRETCPGYYSFNDHYSYPIFSLYWNIKSYDPTVAPTTTTVATKGMLSSIIFDVCSFLVFCGAILGLVTLVMVYIMWKRNERRRKAHRLSSFLVVAPLLYIDKIDIPFIAPPRYEDIDYPVMANY